MLEKSWAKYFADEIFPKIGENRMLKTEISREVVQEIVLVSENELDKSRMTW